MDVETAVLAKSARWCVLCFHFKGDLVEKLGQIAHLDENRTHWKEDNLAWMCLDHHSLYDSKTKQHKNYTIHEVKAARAKLYELVAAGNHLTLSAALPYMQAEADKKVFADLMAVVPSNGAIRFLRTHNFGGSFRSAELEPIERFIHDRNGPDHEFLNTELERARREFRTSCVSFESKLGRYSFEARQEGREGVPQDWEEEDPENFESIVDEIHTAAETLCTRYDDLVRLARKTLAV